MAYNQFNRNIKYTETHKECSWCLEVKLHSEFHKDKTNRYGLAYYCKSCACSKSRKNFKERMQKEEASVYRLQRREYYINSKYGISLEEYKERLALQNHACAICKVKLLANGRLTHFDHCHKTGKLRAFLCTNCNRGLGHFQDSRDLLIKAADYLNTHTISVSSGESEARR